MEGKVYYSNMVGGDERINRIDGASSLDCCHLTIFYATENISNRRPTNPR
jgi:hypothetical protein